MDFKQLESFVTIAKLRSFSKAAEKLYLTQPTISNHIQSLESELGTILFNRTNKNITMTRAGEILYEYAISILNKKETAYFALNEFKGRIEGILEIASSSIPEQYFLVDVIRDFNGDYPDVRYILMKYDSREVIEKLLSGDIDFGIVGSRTDHAYLEYINILDDDMILVAPNNQKFKKLTSLNSESLKSLPLILREEGSGTRDALMKALNAIGVVQDDLMIFAEVEDNETIKKFVMNGLGATFISKRAVEKELEEGSLILIPVEGFHINRQFHFVYHKKRVLAPLAETFKRHILSFYNQQESDQKDMKDSSPRG